MDRASRRLSHQKGSKIVTQTTAPLSSEGDDGDQVMVGSTMYTKSQGRWMPFKSGGGNVNDGWHGSQKYVKILPKDFYLDNEVYDHSIFHWDLAGENGGPLGWGPGYDGVYNSLGVAHPVATTMQEEDSGSGGVTDDNIIQSGEQVPRGMACSVAIPIGYWAIACKIYASHTWGPNAIPIIRRSDSAEGDIKTNNKSGIQIHNVNLEDGSSQNLCGTGGSTVYNFTNTRIVFDTAMLGQNNNYLYIIVNGFSKSPGYPHTGDNYSWMVYGGYVELRRVKTAETIQEEEAISGGDVLPRSTGG